MAEQIGVSELIGIAQAGGSLKDTGFKHTVISAVGMAAAKGRASFVLGAELHRLRCAGQAGRWYIAVDLVAKQILGIARRGRWRKSKVLSVQIARMAGQALQEWLFDLCVPCLGRGRKAIELYTPDGERREQVCQVCGGKGKVTWKGHNMAERMSLLGVTDDDYVKVWDGRFEDVMLMLDKAYGVTQRSVAKRMNRRIEDV